MTCPLVLDVETQYTFQEVGFNPKKLKISVAGIYDYATGGFEIYREECLKDLFKRMEHASEIIGFNIRKFDFPVLSPYYLGNINQFEMLDLLEEVEKSLGHRVALDDLARATLGVKKSGHGFLAIEYYRNQNWKMLEDYCLSDVKITKELYEYAKKTKKLYFNTYRGKKEIAIDLPTEKNKKNVSLILPI